MSKQKFEFEELRGDDWGEYKKTTKKKTKHREEANNNWRFDKRHDYTMDEQDDYEYSNSKARNW